MQGKYRYGCAPVWRFRTVSSWQIHPSDNRFSFLPELLPYILTHIHYKKVQSISQRSPVQWRVETWLVISSPLFCLVSKEGRYSLTMMEDCSLIQYPSTTIVPDTMWMGLGGVVGVSTSCKASIGMVVLQFGGHHAVLSKNFRPTDGRLSFPNELFLFVLTLIHYKMSDI